MSSDTNTNKKKLHVWVIAFTVPHAVAPRACLVKAESLIEAHRIATRVSGGAFNLCGINRLDQLQVIDKDTETQDWRERCFKDGHCPL